MDVSITARHSTLPESAREIAEKRLSRLARFEPKVVSADLIIENDHGAHRVEARILVAGHTMVAHGNGPSFRTALDKAADRLTRQLKRRRERRRDHQAHKLSETQSPAPGGG